MTAWYVSGFGAGPQDCTGRIGEDLTHCQQGAFAEVQITIALIWIMWIIGFVLLGLIWYVTRPKVVRSPESPGPDPDATPFEDRSQ